MKLTFDRNLFTQIGLDSGSLTMLAGVTHRFLEPGQYRGVVYKGKDSIGDFYINVDKNSPVAQANIDLAAFEASPSVPDASGSSSSPGSDCSCQGKGTATAGTKFELNPKGYAVFHVTEGAGGYAVRVGKAAEDPKQQNQFDSHELKSEDIFSGVILRPGTYSSTNALGSKGKGKITVSYPQAGKTAYHPPNPVTVKCSERGFEPDHVEIQPGQAVVFHVAAPARIKVELVKADDGPGKRREHVRPGWKKVAHPEQKKKS
ncbi:MAG: hypothetical protein WAM66_09380 [Acidobacteriaceae bacterium]